MGFLGNTCKNPLHEICNAISLRSKIVSSSVGVKCVNNSEYIEI